MNNITDVNQNIYKDNQTRAIFCYGQLNLYCRSSAEVSYVTSQIVENKAYFAFLCLRETDVQTDNWNNNDPYNP